MKYQRNKPHRGLTEKFKKYKGTLYGNDRNKEEREEM